MLGHQGMTTWEGLEGEAFVRIGVALFKDMCHWKLGRGVEVSEAQASLNGCLSFLLPVDPDVELSVPCLPACCNVSCHADNGLNFWQSKQAPVKYFLLLNIKLHKCPIFFSFSFLDFTSLLCIRIWRKNKKISTNKLLYFKLCIVGSKWNFSHPFLL